MQTGRSRISYTLVVTLAIIAFLVFLFFYIKNQFFATRTEIKEDVMISKITSMGKLELVKYSMKDVIEKKKVNRILPDEKVLFIAVGEVTACIDLTQIKKQDILFSQTADSVTVSLPHAEICYVKLDHQKSRVYDISGAYFADVAKSMVEDIYKLAEQRLLANAAEMNIKGKAEDNARTIFKPLLENISGKKVGFIFK